jgi:hypothetical protein
MAEWTPEEKEEAIEQVHKMLDSSEVVIRNGGYSYNAEIIDLACQRNLLLERFKELHTAGGQVWIEDLIHRIEPEWKSYWTLLAEENARECALANEDGCPTGEHARTEEK